MPICKKILAALSVPFALCGQAPVTGLHQAIERAVYAVESSGEGTYVGTNPGQRLNLEFNRHGAQLTHPNGSVSFHLNGYGYNDRLRKPALDRLTAAGNRVEYQRGELTEWYVNGAQGLEQGFTLSHRPAAEGVSGPLVIAMGVDGGLTPSQRSGQDEVLFASRRGVVLRYGGLTALDARGRTLPSRLQVNGREVRLFVDDRDAQYPVVVDPTWTQQQELTASDGAALDHFGWSVAVDAAGAWAVAGAIYKNNFQGAAYVFANSSGTWNFVQELTASDGAASDNFGISVAVSGTTAIIGAEGQNSNQGAAYVFVYNGSTWAQMQKLIASDGASGDRFGYSVAMSGTTAVIGAESKNSNRGAAYAFVSSGGVWSQQQKLTASDGASGDLFGYSVAVDAGTSTAVIGAYGSAVNKGAVYVFGSSGEVWSQVQKLTASDGVANDLFGYSVAMSTTTAVIGAYGVDGVRGAAYVFASSGGVWSQQKKLTASDGNANDGFGTSVAVLNGTALIGSPGSLSAYAYGNNAGTWNLQQKLLPPDGAAGDAFGNAVALGGTNTALIGAYGKTSGKGAAYSYAGGESVTVTSMPSGLTVTVDGNAITTPQTFNWVSPSSHTFNAATQAGSAGTQYVPVGTFPATVGFAYAPVTQTYNVPFTTQYFLTTSASTGGSITPASGFFNAGSGVQVTATANAGSVFAGFSGGLTGTTNPQTITMNAPAAVAASFTATPLCTYGLTPGSATVPSGTSTGNTVGVTVMNGCQWTAASNSSFISVTGGASGNGNGTVTYSITQANSNSAVRAGSLTIAGQTFNVTQSGMPCQITGLTPSSAAAGLSGGSSSFNVAITPSDCLWVAAPSSTSTFLTTTSAGVGSGVANYTVAVNPSSSPRGGTINVTAPGTQATFTVNQSGATINACTYTLSPPSQPFSSTGGPGSVTVTSQSGCSWTATSTVGWVTITSGLSGAGNGMVSYTVSPNASTASRNTTLNIAGQPYTVTELGTATAAATCAVSLPNGAPLVLLEGRTEIVGAVQIACSGLTSAITAEIVLTLNTNITNTVGAGLVTDAVLTSGGTTQTGLSFTSTTLRWPNVTLTPSGGTATVQLTNVRADASLLSAGSSITGQVSVNSVAPVVVANSNPTVATPVTTLSFVPASTTYQASGISGVIQPVSYIEVVPWAFHATAGGTPATRFRLVLSNIPTGVQVYAPVYPANGPTQGQLYSADCSGEGGSAVSGSTLAGATYSQLTVIGGVATATWVVLSADQNNFDTLTFPMLVTGTGNSTAWSQIKMAGSYAPASPAGVTACGSSDPSANAVPRYRDFSVPLQFANLEIVPTITYAPNGVVTFTVVVTNLGSQTWAGTINSDVFSGLGGSTIQIACSQGDVTCSLNGGEASWNLTIPPLSSVTLQGSGVVQGTLPSVINFSVGAASSAIAVGAIPVPPAPPVVHPGGSSPQVQVNSLGTGAVSGTVTVTGFAVASLNHVTAVQIYANGNLLGPAVSRTTDPDGICNSNASLGSPDCPNVGFSYSLDTTRLANGANSLTAVATDDDSNGSNSSGTSAAVMLNVQQQVVTVSISGQVTVGGTGLSGVVMNVTGSLTTSVTTNSSGNYSFTLPSNGTYTIAPFRLGYSFTTPVTFTNVTTNQTANFTGIAAPGLDFYPVTPCRIADTRVPAGFSGQFGPPSMPGGQTRVFNILSSPCATGIPATVAAYSLNFTVVPPAGGPAANLTTWPLGLGSMPVVSTLNYAGNVVANAAIVPAGLNGAINVYVNFPTDVLFDINGYFAAPQSTGLTFFTLTPCRIADTRVMAGFTGQFGPPSMPGGATRTFTLPASPCGVPANATAYSLNFTVVPPSTDPPANLTTWPATQTTMPNVSTLNYSGSVVANAAIVPAGTNSAINVFVNYPTDMLFDTNGYFASSTSGLHYYPVNPCRIADTRAAAGFTGQFGPPSMPAGATRTFTIPASSCGIPANASAYALNFTVVPPQGGPAANLTTWPTGAASMPNVSTLNFYGSVVANAAIVPAGTNGAINVFVNYPSDLLFDINGYFAP